MFKGKTWLYAAFINLIWLVLSWFGIRKTEGRFWKIFRKCLLFDILYRIACFIALAIQRFINPEDTKKFLENGEI